MSELHNLSSALTKKIMLSALFQTVDPVYLLLSALLFMIGLYWGPLAAEREITILLKYPRWMLSLMERYFKSDYNFIIIFLLILAGWNGA